jgi:putative oxygen-independent coproporphyrinogen III oxidase
MVIPTSVYIHIPFCRRRCFYCDFPITVLGDNAPNNYLTVIDNYVEILLKEIKLTPNLGSSLKTIFFGGGTPSLLPIYLLEKILDSLDHKFGINPNAEISLEVDPDTFDKNQLQCYQKLGINRISLGIQAFQDELLEKCGRNHRVKDIFKAVELIKQVNFTNFSLDLISGLPHQTLKQWEFSLKNAINCQPKHISCYDLVLEEVTPFGKQYQPGNKPLPSDKITAKMYCLAQEILTDGGYNHYEISNYAKPDYQCCHNRVYWEIKPYYGFGMGAASFTNNIRFTRPRTRQKYYDWVNSLVDSQGIIKELELSPQDLLLETLMLGLRLQEGVNLLDIKQKFGEEIYHHILIIVNKFMKENLIEFEIKTQRLRLNDPQGFLFSNTILAEIFHKLS